MTPVPELASSPALGRALLQEQALHLRSQRSEEGSDKLPKNSRISSFATSQLSFHNRLWM